MKFSIWGLSFTDEEAQQQELDELIGHQIAVPEDVDAFIKSLEGELGEYGLFVINFLL